MEPTQQLKKFKIRKHQLILVITFSALFLTFQNCSSPGIGDGSSNGLGSNPASTMSESDYQALKAVTFLGFSVTKRTAENEATESKFGTWKDFIYSDFMLPAGYDDVGVQTNFIENGTSYIAGTLFKGTESFLFFSEINFQNLIFLQKQSNPDLYYRMDKIIRHQGKVYILGSYGPKGSGLTDTGFWIDGVWEPIRYSPIPGGTSDRLSATDFLVLNDQIHVAGYSIQDRKPVLWKDGSATMLPEPMDHGIYGTPYRMASIGNDWYASADMIESSTGKLKAGYYKNGAFNFLQPPTVDGVLIDDYEQQGLKVLGNDVYILGDFKHPTAEVFRPIYWKNGEPKQLPVLNPSWNAYPTTIYQINGKLLILGSIFDAKQIYAGYWFDDVFYFINKESETLDARIYEAFVE
jgi:hypothetical protein